MKKYLFAALALPMAFAACTQDDFSEGVNTNTPDAKGLKVTVNATKAGDDAASRLDWNGSTASWTTADKISMFYLGTPFTQGDKALSQTFNSIFATTDGSQFTSESMVYEGGNIAVFPAQMTTTKGGEITLKINEPLKKGDTANMPFISNVLTVTANEDLHTNAAGYHGAMYTPMKQAANQLALTINFSNIPTVAGVDFEVKSVELVSNAAQFATTAAIKASETAPNDPGEFPKGDNVVNTITNQAWVAANPTVTTLTSQDITMNGTTAVVNFIVFPTNANSTVATDEAVIRVNTNMGYYDIKTREVSGVTVDQLSKGTTKEDVKTVLNMLASNQTATDSRFKGENVGKKASRTASVDMKNSVLDGSKVYSSEDIIAYTSLYKALNKTDNMNLNLKSADESADKPFVGLSKAALAAVAALNADGVKVTLNATGVNAVTLSDGGAVYAIPDAANNGDGDITYNLAADKTWTLDQSADLGVHVTAINNFGTLSLTNTVATTSNKHKDALDYALNNEAGAAITLGSTAVTLGGFSNKSETNNGVTNGTVTVAAGKTLNLSATTENDGIITNNGDLLAIGTGVLNNHGSINNAGFISVQNGGTAAINNDGTITNTSANGVILITNNEIESTKGSIILKNRNDEVAVNNGGEAQGYIKYAITGSEYKYAAGDKMNYLIVKGDIKLTGILDKDNTVETAVASKINYLEVAASSKLTCNIPTTASFTEVIVKKDATMYVNTGNILSTSKLLISGKVIVGGTLNYVTCTEDNLKKIYTTGSGSVNGPATNM